MNPLELRSLIESLLTGLLGTYTFTTEAGVQTAPAIVVDDGTQQLFQPDTQGLEVVIQLATADKYVPYLGGAYGGELETRVTLKQWDLAANTLAAIERLKQLPNLKEIGPRVTRNSRLDNIEICTLTLIDYPYSG